MFYLLKSEASILLFGILLHGKFCLFSLTGHGIIYLHKLWLMELILYLGYSSKLLYSISQAILSLASGMLSVGSCVYVCCTFSLPG